MNNTESSNIELRSATMTTTPVARNAVPQVSMLIDTAKCIGCKACTTACYQWNDLREEIGDGVGNYDPEDSELSDRMWTTMRFNEVERDDGGVEWLMRKDACMHCGEPACLKACPAPGAIVKHTNGIVDINQANCIGCGYCVSACPFNIPRVSQRDNKAYKCTFCVDRVSAGMTPGCAKVCPTGAIMFGTKPDMQARAAKRVVDLQQRGFQQAALYDPPGVGGTGVMYVLPRGDQPELYNGLPNNPRNGALLEMWRGITKPLMSVGLGLGVLALFYHYVTVGPEEEDGPPGGHGHADPAVDTDARRHA